jgi:hypothetical protein
MGQIKGIISNGQIFDPEVKNSLNGPIEAAFDFLTGQPNVPDGQLVKLKTGFGINDQAIKVKARATFDVPDGRAKVRLDLVINGNAQIDKEGYVKEFFADDASGDLGFKQKKSGFQQDYTIATTSPFTLVKGGLGGNFAAILGSIDFG